ncbi:cation diffusion facilitator family transporter [Agromyces seonyuensis]|uniref:Cation diffusion facilitator family transporter n=1 Tax=Agromyces seonyuensis TaxID=2662446 RepID=A0A6I4NSG6_9MICO|nr:cation diffusion facilitator family transporter [Agromyces seonyuensis]MWB97193.1 cation diffusion facilitator family transporter [Agromyces seonyuensis]
MTDERTTTAGGSSESLLTVLVALVANVLIAIAKTIAAMLTGSASMVAESAHSWADSGNEVLLLVAERRSRKPADARRPLGYGKDAYIWSMFAAFGLFAVGAAVSITHGITELLDPEPASDYVIAYVVLAISFVLEGVSFTRAYLQTRRSARARGVSTLARVLHHSDPTLRAVFAEDAAALIGLLIAGAGVGLHQATGSPVPDAIGSILVGVLLGVVAIILIARNRDFLLGESVDLPTRDAVLAGLLANEGIERVTSLRIQYLGPGTVSVVAAVDLAGNAPEDDVAYTLRRLEQEIAANPHVGLAVLTLSAPDEPSVHPGDPVVPQL